MYYYGWDGPTFFNPRRRGRTAVKICGRHLSSIHSKIFFSWFFFVFGLSRDQSRRPDDLCIEQQYIKVPTGDRIDTPRSNWKGERKLPRSCQTLILIYCCKIFLEWMGFFLVVVIEIEWQVRLKTLDKH